MNYRIQRQNETYGPYPLEEVRRLFAAGNLHPTDLAWPEGSQTPVTVGSLLQAAQGDHTGGVIPYKNPQALTAYYLAVASLIPCIGILTGIPALVLGIKGLKRAKREPWIRGKAHAWIGIIVGGGLALVWIVALGFFVIAMALNRPQ
ncbi:GYF domain-containing protein [Verrucomicrobium sp. BvORR106]|uniref:GYF domain-containing protein n=1 Tax=Verrucomicrobium sp. BvORR106 TaxID=1403819 RepID=UPI00056E1D45|nr:GYF domain-containing protein [Verrucomicrobium sp. BvORR106]